MHNKSTQIRLYEEKLCLCCDLEECNQSLVGGCYVNGIDRHFNREIYAKLGHGITREQIDKSFFKMKTERILKVFIKAKMAEQRGDIICLR